MSQEYETVDLGVAAYLILQGHELHRLEPDPDSRRLVFVFSETAESEVDGYFGINGTTYPVRQVLDVVKGLKARIYEAKRRRGQR